MKSLLLLIFLFSNNCKTPPTTVYLCDSPNAKKYHLNAKCRGLNNCGYKIIKTSLEKAKKQAKTLCKWEE